jgi:hypothetical protein
MVHGAPTYPPVPQRPAPPNTSWWFLIPLLTFGFGTFVMVLIGALKLKAKPHLYAAIGYLVVTLAMCAAADTASPETNAEPSTVSTLFTGLYVLVVWAGGTVHTAFLQKLVAKLAPPAPPGPGGITHTPDSAVAAAAWRAGRRQEARALMASNPTMAWELRIGRPDLDGRQYDDGGLVDVNNVPAGWLAYALQIPQDLADEIVQARAGRLGGFSSVEELVYDCPRLTLEMVSAIRDVMVFRPL